MKKKSLVYGLILLLLVAGGAGYALSQLLLERNVTGTVTVASQPDLYVLDQSGKPVSLLDFGTLSNGVRLNKTIRLANMGNTPLTIVIMRNDTSIGISSLVKRQSGSPYDNLSPTTLGIGESLYLILEIWNPSTLVAGAYPLNFKVTGS